MTTKPEALKIQFEEYLSNIQSLNSFADSRGAKMLEFVILLIFNKCNNWNLKTLPINFPAIDLYDYDLNIAIQVKSKNLQLVQIIEDLKKIELYKNNVIQFQEIRKHIYFAPTIDEKVYKSLIVMEKNIELFDKNKICDLMISSNNFEYYLSLFNVNNCYFSNKVSGFYNLNKEKEYNQKFIFNKTGLTREIPDYKKLLTKLYNDNILVLCHFEWVT